MLLNRDLRQISVVGLGLLGGSIALAVSRAFPNVKVVGFSHRPSTRAKAKQLSVETEIADSIASSVSKSDLVILASPICTFEQTFAEIRNALSDGCIVTDVGSTKLWPHRWAAKRLPKAVHYIGSHPIAGSEQRGIEFARDDLFERAVCILTVTKNTNRRAVRLLTEFWSGLGCIVRTMTPARHDKIFANVSHLTHIMAVSLVNANTSEDMKFAGKGFIDTSRIASGPANIWADVLMTNTDNVSRGIDKIISELTKLKIAVKSKNYKKIESILERARCKRAALIKYKMSKKELVS